MLKAPSMARKFIKNASSFKSSSPMCTIASKTIQLTFVDVEGNRATVPARVGQSLLNVAQLHKIDIEGPCGGGGGPTSVRRTENWVETTYGEGPTCFYCHVQISSKYNSILPEESQHQMIGLSHVWDDEATRTSRLACMIELDKRHDGMIIFVPDAPVTDVV